MSTTHDTCNFKMPMERDFVEVNYNSQVFFFPAGLSTDEVVENLSEAFPAIKKSFVNVDIKGNGDMVVLTGRTLRDLNAAESKKNIFGFRPAIIRDNGLVNVSYDGMTFPMDPSLSIEQIIDVLAEGFPCIKECNPHVTVTDNGDIQILQCS